MCGFIRRVTDSPAVVTLLLDFGIDVAPLNSGDFYPGSLMSIIFHDGQQLVAQEARWWFLLDPETGKPNYQYATFNARNLQSKLWREPLRHNRCIVVATAFAESNGVGKDKRTVLLEADNAFVLGGLYRWTPAAHGNLLSTALITCPPHPRLCRYHEKSTPLFLPQDTAWIHQWLDPSQTLSDTLMSWLAQPQLPTSFTVTPVQSTKRLNAIGLSERLEKD